jgi:uncharacterized protein
LQTFFISSSQQRNERFPVSVSSKLFRIGRAKTGLGLFATQTIKRGTHIISYIGKKISNAAADRMYTKYIFELNGRYSIDGKSRRNIARYINHSCKPNSTIDIVRGEIRIKSIRRIEPGTEITYNYGPGYFDAFIKPIGCKCEPCVQKRRRARKLAARRRARKAV